MGAALVALAGSIAAGVSWGIVLTLVFAARSEAIRPRSWLRAVAGPARGVGCVVAVVASGVAVGGVVRAEYSPAALAVTCAAVATLIAVATWLLSIEGDDGGHPGATPDEPEWWPAFERDLQEWTRERSPVAGRR